MKYALALLLLAGCAPQPFSQTWDVMCYDTRSDTITARWVYMDSADCFATHCILEVREFKTYYRIAEGEACSVFRSDTE